ncbi:MAG: sulfotransferase domain-containing protein [Pseudomonadota bacterium]|nr:sulfotransferase domain-containing protein [Pseudomonadota bacterium]
MEHPAGGVGLQAAWHLYHRCGELRFQEYPVRKPDFFIVGAPKCGTTAMQHYLSQHPDIFLPKKEMDFFGSDQRFTRPRCTIEQYLAHFDTPEAKTRRRVGEKSVFYLYSKRAAYEIRDFAGATDIIIMLRNPVDMLYSLHSHMLRTEGEEIEDFRAALEDESIRKQRARNNELIISGLFYMEIGKYTDQVKRYFDRFGRETVHIIIYDDLKQDAASVYRETLRFLNIDDRFQPTFKIVNPNKQVRSKTFESLLWTLKSNPFGSIARQGNGTPTFASRSSSKTGAA